MLLPKSKLIKMAKEEAKTSKEYARMGLKRFSKDEARHSRFFRMLAKKR